jgi:hypothetical protein
MTIARVRLLPIKYDNAMPANKAVDSALAMKLKIAAV